MSGKVVGCSKSVSMVYDRVGMSFGIRIVNLHSDTFRTMAFGANLALRAGSSFPISNVMLGRSHYNSCSASPTDLSAPIGRLPSVTQSSVTILPRPEKTSF